LAGAALDAGVLVELAALVREPLELVLAVADEFEAFWTLGGGAGELKANWMGQLREHVRRGGWRGKVKPPGLLEHERHIERELGVGLPPGWSRHPGIKGAYLDEAGRTRKRARA
jgi:hypothetical protein